MVSMNCVSFTVCLLPLTQIVVCVLCESVFACGFVCYVFLPHFTVYRYMDRCVFYRE